MTSKKILTAAIIMAIVIVGGIAWYGLSYPTANAQKETYYIQLTDPPTVPTGTSALTLNYSAIALHVEGSGWININASGSLNLMALLNVSELIGIAQVPNGSIINQVRFVINSSSITVNGTTYNVVLANRMLEVPVVGASKASTTAILQLSPVVVQTFVGTTPVFFMVPSATAVTVQGGINQNSKAALGDTYSISNRTRDDLEYAQGNVSVVAASLTSSGNRTLLSLTLKNNGNTSISLESVALSGWFTLTVPPVVVSGRTFNGTILVENASIRTDTLFLVNGTNLVPITTMLPHEFRPMGIIASGDGQFNFINKFSMEQGLSGGFNTESFIQGNENGMGNVNDQGNMNGQNKGNMEIGNSVVALDQNRGGDTVGEQFQFGVEPANVSFNSGYIIKANQTATFSFNGTLTFLTPGPIGAGFNDNIPITLMGSAYLTPISGFNYTLFAALTQHTKAVTTVTAA